MKPKNSVAAAWTTPTPIGDDSGYYSHLLDLLERPAWHHDAACRGLGAEMFYPERGEHLDAREVCKTCPVITQCAEAGLTEPRGIWGGKSALERKNSLTRKRPIPECGTRGGYERHKRQHTAPCEPCTTAFREDHRQRNKARYDRRRQDGWCNRCAMGSHNLCKGRVLDQVNFDSGRTYLPCECPERPHEHELEQIEDGAA